jgi:hypothetical protein
MRRVSLISRYRGALLAGRVASRRAAPRLGVRAEA